MSKLRLKETGRTAHVEMGAWNGVLHEIDAYFPVAELSDGTFVVVLGTGALPDEPKDSPDREAIMRKKDNN